MAQLSWGGPSTGPTLLFGAAGVSPSPCRCEPLRAAGRLLWLWSSKVNGVLVSVRWLSYVGVNLSSAPVIVTVCVPRAQCTVRKVSVVAMYHVAAVVIPANLLVIGDGG